MCGCYPSGLHFSRFTNLVSFSGELPFLVSLNLTKSMDQMGIYKDVHYTFKRHIREYIIDAIYKMDIIQNSKFHYFPLNKIKII